MYTSAEPVKRQVQSTQRMATRVVALAASAGGVTALKTVLSALPGDLKAAVVIVQHLFPSRPSLMAQILSKTCQLRVMQAREGDPLVEGKAYIAPPDQHLLVREDRTIELSQSEQVLHVRPSANLLFESVSTRYRDRVIAVVLTGTGMDGARGVQAVKAEGGIVIAQDEATSDFFGMPGAAIDTGLVDYILPLERVAPVIIRLVSGGSE